MIFADISVLLGLSSIIPLIPRKTAYPFKNTIIKFKRIIPKNKMIFADISVLLPVSPLYYDRPLSGGRKGGCELGPRPYFEKPWRNLF